MGQTSAPPRKKQGTARAGAGGRWRLWQQKTRLVAGSRYRLSPRGSGQPPPPSSGSWETELSGGREQNET